MNNSDEQYQVLLQEILDNHQSYSNEILDLKLKEYYKSIPYNYSVSSLRLNQIIKSRFPEGTHWKTYTIEIKND